MSLKLLDILTEDLRKWFGKGGEGSTTGGGWDRYNSKGEKVGKCGDAKEGESYSACLSKEKASKLGKSGIASFVNRKRATQKKKQIIYIFTPHKHTYNRHDYIRY